MITIEIWSDINCPFCYIGKRHLESALKNYQGQYKVEWKSFELDPFAKPTKGISQTELLAKKYGKDIQWANEMNANMTRMAKEAGLDFKMDQLIPANSFNAHRLIHLAKAHGKQDEMKECLLKARFVEAQDIGDLMTLEKLGIEVGLPADEVKELLQSQKFENDVRHDENMASELGIRGVPFFVFNRKYALSGAQPVEAFEEVLQSLS